MSPRKSDSTSSVASSSFEMELLMSKEVSLELSVFLFDPLIPGGGVGSDGRAVCRRDSRPAAWPVYVYVWDGSRYRSYYQKKATRHLSECNTS